MPEAVQVFHFRCLDRPIAASELPKLPPRAVHVILGALKERGLDPRSVNLQGAEGIALLSDLACQLVWLTLRRVKPSVTLADVVDNEDWDEVAACMAAVRARNPSIFTEKPAKTEPAEVPADPPSARSVPATSPSAP